MKLRPTGIKHTNKHSNKCLFCSACRDPTLYSSFGVARNISNRRTSSHTLPSPSLSLSCSTLPPLALASVPACHPASYGPLSRPRAPQRGTLITGCRPQAPQAVGPKLMGCQALLKQEHINVSACGWRAGQKGFTAGEDQGDHLGEQRYYSVEESSERTYREIAYRTKGAEADLFTPAQYKQMHTVRSQTDGHTAASYANTFIHHCLLLCICTWFISETKCQTEPCFSHRDILPFIIYLCHSSHKINCLICLKNDRKWWKLDIQFVIAQLPNLVYNLKAFLLHI